ncbi:DUF6632 domain-containing protein [Kribbella sp. DT2]|uniref:DUF6632 domain-containing protein n=1 Tax=Kribbella sp. DT2 TaxID=3393427 RepID=UPI003CF9B5FD
MNSVTNSSGPRVRGPEDRWLRITLRVVGISFLAGVYPFIHLWPAGFRWQPGQSEYEQMIAAIYAVLGIFLIRAARDPLNHLSLVWFTVWSSLAHAAVMAAAAVRNSHQWVHLIGDVPALLVAAAALAALAPRQPKAPPGPGQSDTSNWLGLGR